MQFAHRKVLFNKKCFVFANSSTDLRLLKYDSVSALPEEHGKVKELGNLPNKSGELKIQLR